MAMGMNNKEDFAVGCVLSIKTALGEEFEGQVITFNRPFNILVLQEGSESGPRKNTRMLNANYIKEFNLIRKVEDPLDLKCCYHDLNTLLAREDFAIRQAEMEAERIGVGVTVESALSRTATDRESMEEDAFSDFLIHEISDFFIWEWRDFLFREWAEPGTFLLANYAPAPKGTLKTIVDDNGRVIDFVRHLVPSGTVGVPRMSKLELEARTQYTKEEKEKLHRHKRHKLSYSSTVVEMCTVKPPSMPHPPFDFSKISLLFAEKEMRILMVGLTGAGKTTILNKLNHGDIVTTINPSSGFKVKTLEHKNISFTAWDLEGDDKLRALWRPYYHSIQAIIFVLDSSDRKRVVEARNELYRILYEDELKDAPLLFIANKEDIINSMSTPEVSNKLCIRTIRRECLLQRGSAISGEGLYEGLNWLSNNIANKAKSGEVGGN